MIPHEVWGLIFEQLIPTLPHRHLYQALARLRAVSRLFHAILSSKRWWARLPLSDAIMAAHHLQCADSVRWLHSMVPPTTPTQRSVLLTRLLAYKRHPFTPVLEVVRLRKSAKAIIARFGFTVHDLVLETIISFVASRAPIDFELLRDFFPAATAEDLLSALWIHYDPNEDHQAIARADPHLNRARRLVPLERQRYRPAIEWHWRFARGQLGETWSDRPLVIPI